LPRTLNTVAAIVTAMTATMTATAAPAQSGDVVMRRPIPKLAGGGGSTPDGGVVSEPNEVPGTPEETVCDQGGDAGAKLTSVKWVEAGWSDGGMNAESCSVQKMTYTCQATYTCVVGGSEQSFVSDAADTVCEGSKDPVEYPGDTPDPTRFPSERSIADQVAWFVAKTDAAVKVQQAGGSGAGGSPAVRAPTWFRSMDQIKWWTPGEYSPSGHLNYIRVFIDPGGDGLYDANSALCGQMRAAGHPCSNYYSHEGGSVFVAWILG
jgi:hypothetical protein